MPEKVPLWIIRNTFCSYGSKMPPRPDTMNPNAKQCETCEKWLNTFNEWEYWRGKIYCKEHAAQAQKDNPYTNTNYGGSYVNRGNVTAMPPRHAGFMEGNLEETLYKFWIGTELRYSLRSTCRACGEVVFNSDARKNHKELCKTLYKNNISCWFVLGLIHKKLEELGWCAVCGRNANHKQKWGIPLCSPECIKIWKFDEKHQYPLIEAQLQKFWANPPKTETKNGGSIILDSSSNPISTVIQSAEEE